MGPCGFPAGREQDGEENINVDVLLLLGSAYEANGMVTEAMDLYEEIYTDIVPNRPEAYRSMTACCKRRTAIRRRRN